MNDRSHRAKRLAEVSDEIRRYPSPIARCDEHLAALIEERACLMQSLEEPSCLPLDLWINDGGPCLR